jgi:hypothetical protein
MNITELQLHERWDNLTNNLIVVQGEGSSAGNIAGVGRLKT